MKNDHTYRSLLRIGLPILASLCVSQIQMITDQAFLGHASPEYLTAVGNAGYTIWTTISFLFALGTGTAILVSQKLGEKRHDQAEEIAGSTFVYSSFFAIIVFFVWFFGSRRIFTAMGLKDPILSHAALYAKVVTAGIVLTGFTSASNAIYNGTGYTRPLMITSILRAVINIALDWLLIFGNLGFPRLGILGAAVATLVADIVGSGYSISRAFSRSLPLRMSFRAIRRANLRNYLSVIKVGIPASLEEFSWNAGNILLIRFLNQVDAMAAGIYTIIMAVTLIPALIFTAVGNAAMTLSGRRTGEGRPEEISRTGKAALTMSAFVAVAFALAFTFAPNVFVGLFTKDEGIMSQTGKLMLISSINLFPRAANIIYGGNIRGMGDTRWMLGTQAFGTAFVVLSAWLLIFRFEFGITGLFLAVFLDETVRAFLNGYRFYSSVRRRVREIEVTRGAA